MLVENQYVEIKWHQSNKEHYTSLGYDFTNYGDIFLVKANDLGSTSQKKVKVVCDECGKEYEMYFCSYYRAIQKRGSVLCSQCSQHQIADRDGLARMPGYYESFLNFCKEHDYIPISKMEDMTRVDSPIKYLCKKHGERETNINNINHGRICSLCATTVSHQKKSMLSLPFRQEKLYEKALKMAGKNGYTLITSKEEITTNVSVIEYLCPKHGKHSMRIANFNCGYGCPECAIEKLAQCNTLSVDDVCKRVAAFGGTLMNPTEYIDRMSKNLIIKCPICGECFTTSLSRYEKNCGRCCGNCSKKESTGERAVRNFLQKNDIKFEQEWWFQDCRDINPLPFDFYLPDNNTCIEYDGVQHYEKNQYRENGDADLAYIQSHDEIKTKYCEENRIKLIRIPYFDFKNIDEILTKELNLHR